LVINPVYEQLEPAQMELFVSGTSEAVMSVEGGGHEIPEDEVIDTIIVAHEEIKEIIRLQEGLIALCGRPTREYQTKEIGEALNTRIRSLATSKIQESIGMEDKKTREDYLEQVQVDVLSEILDDDVEEEDVVATEKDTISILGDIEKEQMRQSILNEGTEV